MRARFVLAALALGCASVAHADSGSLSVTAVVLSKSSCRITGANPLTLAFGTINPASTADATASVGTTIRCTGSAPQATYSLTASNGQNPLGAGNRRMRHATVATEFLPYSLAINPASATITKGVTQLITISGTITPAQFQDARAGAFSDVVAITIAP